MGTEVTVFTGMDFNTKNTEADYQSGDIFHIDGTLAQHLPLFGGFAGVGVNGSYYKQFTADSGLRRDWAALRRSPKVSARRLPTSTFSAKNNWHLK